MKLIQLVSVFFVFSQVFAESEYHNYQTHYDQQNIDPYAAYNSDLTSAYSNSISEKDSGYGSNDLDMDVILPIVVFGGLGLGALAYVDSLRRMNDLCNKLRDITNVSRTGGAVMANVALATGANGAGDATAVNNANTVINSNTAFINALAAITTLDC